MLFQKKKNPIYDTIFIHRTLQLFKVQTRNRIQAVHLTVFNSPRIKNRKSKTIDSIWLKIKSIIHFADHVRLLSCRCCPCNCQNNKIQVNNQRNINYNATNNNASTPNSPVGGKIQVINTVNNKLDVGCQTLSTGDIVIMKVHFKEDSDKGSERVIVPSPKRNAQ